MDAFHAATAPSAVLPTTSEEDTIERILQGSTQTDFTRQQRAPVGSATLHALVIRELWNYDADGQKSLDMQHDSLSRTDVFGPHLWPVFAGKEGSFHETQSMVGVLHPLKRTKDPGARIPSFSLLPWVKDGQFKCV